MLARGCQGYLANMVDKEQEMELKPEDVPIIREYVDVFPKDLPGLPPEREISFEIELLPGAAPKCLTVWPQPNLGNSKYSCKNCWTKDSFDKAIPHGEHRFYSSKRRMDHCGCASNIAS